ncbi:alpha/beta hydrolase [Psychrobacter sp. AOP22-C1-22]|uniref:alpha/beta hydrolase n=1 Tax=unclassified Psychrobacter TaxID=196806 RepID=UPI0017885EB8|nr:MULTISPECIES: alpha/beta hydrolase [unclassified Psychrobacter]MBE0405455.1 dienelactone hydrolase family protein [Psychrobacter sp. FME6]MBE0444401.1 dienelactone hydrolase family protein [Psychrobacter sp. FME5]MDN5802500.1 alpha/beta hydrolase [Psychrobacter sp.]MDN5897917.1 alpha/beta hydrolase [Psychrobacter sp.]
MSNYLDAVIVEHNPSQKKIDRAVIWLHGLGASGHDFEPIVPQLGLADNMAVRFIFPHAPKRAVTVNGGMVMPAWYDIIEMSLERKIDVTQIEESSQQIRELISRELERGVSPEHIVIAGFSQGGAVAYHVALSYPERLAGLMTLSTYLATNDNINYSTANKNIPILIEHGTHDPVVPSVLGEQAQQLLSEKGYNVVYHTYPMAHQVCMPQIQNIGKWLNKVLA